MNNNEVLDGLTEVFAEAITSRLQRHMDSKFAEMEDAIIDALREYASGDTTINAAKASEMLKTTRPTFDKRVREGIYPPPIKVTTPRLWRKSDIIRTMREGTWQGAQEKLSK